MKIGKICWKKMELGDKVSINSLFNNDRASGLKSEFKRVIIDCFKKGILGIEKYELTDYLSEDEYYELMEYHSRDNFILRDWIKDYTNEPESKLVPFVEILKRAYPEYIIDRSTEAKNGLFFQNYPELSVGYSFKNSNARARIYLHDTESIYSSINDNLENLIECLKITKDSLCIVGCEPVGELKRIFCYRLSKKQEFNEAVEDLVKSVMADMYKYEV